MSSVFENMLDSALTGLGSKSRLAHGFRLQAKGKQTVAVYFSDNEPGNAVEIGLNPAALSPLLKLEEGEFRRWIAGQAAKTGRTRTQRGPRGSYPGVAFGSQRELEEFIDALNLVRAGKMAEPPTLNPNRVSTENAALEVRFEELPIAGELAVDDFAEAAIDDPEECPILYPDELPQGAAYLEGVGQQILVNRYERSQEARNACISHYGCVCQVCNFDFFERYGDLGRGFIHVHHRKPIASIKSEYVVDPVKDLVPVCPNCHAMLHRREPPFEVDELRTFMQD